MPSGAIQDCIDLIMKVATQGDRQEVLEDFKGYFCSATGAAHSRSSSASWAETDLWTYARVAATNAPLFIEAFYDACQSFPGDPTLRFRARCRYDLTPYLRNTTSALRFDPLGWSLEKTPPYQ